MKGKKSIGSIWPKWPYCDSRFGQYAGCHVFVVSILGFCICILYMWRYFHVWELANTWIIYPGIMLYYGNKKYWIVHNLYWLCHKLWHYIFARVHRPPALIKRRHGCVAPGPIGLFFSQIHKHCKHLINSAYLCIHYTSLRRRSTPPLHNHEISWRHWMSAVMATASLTALPDRPNIFSRFTLQNFHFCPKISLSWIIYEIRFQMRVNIYIFIPQNFPFCPKYLPLRDFSSENGKFPSTW